MSKNMLPKNSGAPCLMVGAGFATRVAPARKAPRTIGPCPSLRARLSLPDGLEPGTLVRLLKWRIGYWSVIAHDRQWEVSMTNIDPGQEFLIRNQWLHERHPVARREIARLRAVDPH